MMPSMPRGPLGRQLDAEWNDVQRSLLNFFNAAYGRALGASQYLPPKDVARKLKIRNSVVYDAIKSGELDAIRMGREWRIHPDDAMAWAASLGVI